MTQMHNELTTLFTELGEASPEIYEIIEHASAPRWAIALEGDLAVTAEYDEGAGTLCFCADIGQPDEAHRNAVWEAMLMYASLRQSNGGFSTAVADPGGECQLLREAAVQELDVRRLRTAMLEFTEKAQLWRDVVAHGANAAKLAPPAAELLHSGIRC